MDERTINEFFGGRNSDTIADKLPPNQYVSATNVELDGDSSFHALRNIKGTTLVQQLSTSATFKVLKTLPNKYLISGELVDCLTIFSIDGTTFKIQCYDVAGDTLYDLYTETTSSSITEVDAKNGPENGVDIVYFTDFYNELRYFKCEIPDPYSANFLSAYDLSLLRKGANGKITATVAANGTLLSGTYQFSYRMCDPTNKRFTKWSSPTNPIHVYSAANSTSVVNSGIGLITNRKISLTITPSAAETDNFDYIQIAVIENVGPATAIVNDQVVSLPNTASVLDIEEISGTSLSYDYKSNSRIDTIPLEEITVDLAQIEKVKTLAIKDNRLFAGNVHYTNLTMDNGTPVASGNIITSTNFDGDIYSSDDFASNYKGYFRGEVYRFGLVYRDENGNAAPVQILDLSGISDNDITVGLTDLKFPDRTNPDYTLFDSTGNIQALGLRLVGLINHPTWARSVEVVRVNRTGRLKNILFQTPIIPMSKVYGTGAVGRYPSVIYADTHGNTRTEDDATPMTSSYTLVPKNLYWPELRNIVQVGSYGTDDNQVLSGEVGLVQPPLLPFTDQGHDYSMVFPPDLMYGDPAPLTGAEKVDLVDYALLKLSYDTEDTTKTVTVVNGDDVNTNISGTFYALADNQYYFNSGHSKSSLGVTGRPVTDHEFFQGFGQPATVAGKSVMDYDALQTGGIDLGYKPNVQKSAVIKLGGTSIPDPSAPGGTIAFSAATWNGFSAGNPISSSSASIVYEDGATNTYITDYPTFSDDPLKFANVVGIVNVNLGIGDDRYGESTDLHEYISTGAKYTFSDAEVATLEAGGSVSIDLDVWGGDCFVGPHVFKVCDSTYSVMNQPKINGSTQDEDTLLSKWNNTLFNKLNGGGFLCLPVAVENAAQYVQVILESEYNGEVRESDILEGSADAIPIMTGEPSTARTPLTYKYNINLNKNNSQKIYVPKPQFSFEQNEFGARVIYSDLKIYNSDQAGFDVFRVANIYDIDEKFRPITKLALAGDNLYSIHEQGINYLPIGEKQIEQADGGTLAIRSGDVVGGVIVVDSERGSQNINGIVETGSVIYIPDNRNKNVYVLGGQQLQSITKDNETIFRAMLATNKTLVGLYDPFRNEYWIADGTDCHVFSEKRGVWVSNYTLNLKGGAGANQTLYVLALNGSDTSAYSFYTGDVGTLCGASVESTVEFSVNPNPASPKTYDNLTLNASERLSGANFVVKRETSLGNQTATKSVDVTPREGNYIISNPRDAAGARLRGPYALITLTWGAAQSVLKSVVTKFRYSARR